jgi:lipoyl(octanoyl) transferase
MGKEQVHIQNLGLIDYDEAWNLQEEIFDEVVQAKLQRREVGTEKQGGKHYLLYCEHPHVYTLGRNGREENLLLQSGLLESRGIQFRKINRGGDITYHGPGQIVGYPILDLDCLFTDIGRYLRCIEEMVIQLLADYGLKGERLEGATGVWLDASNPFKARKICAIGIRASRWVTMHGFALNVNTDLDYFRHIIPCGIDDKAVASLSTELGSSIEVEEVRQRLTELFCQIFEMEMAEEV